MDVNIEYKPVEPVIPEITGVKITLSENEALMLKTILLKTILGSICGGAGQGAVSPLRDFVNKLHRSLPGDSCNNKYYSQIESAMLIRYAN